MHHNGSDSESSEMLNWYQLRITDIKDCFIAGLLYGPCKWVAQFKSFASFLWNKFKPNQFRHLIPPPFAERAGIKIKFIRNISDQHLYLPKREKKRWRIFLSFFNHRHRLFSKSPSPWKISKFTRISPPPFPSLLHGEVESHSHLFLSSRISRGEIVGASKDCNARFGCAFRLAYYVTNRFAPRFEISGVTRVECLRRGLTTSVACAHAFYYSRLFIYIRDNFRLGVRRCHLHFQLIL